MPTKGERAPEIRETVAPRRPGAGGLGGSTGAWRNHSRRTYFQTENPRQGFGESSSRMRDFGPPPPLVGQLMNMLGAGANSRDENLRHGRAY
jgi:hypothetical protein